jgi:hypothetical protein
MTDFVTQCGGVEESALHSEIVCAALSCAGPRFSVVSYASPRPIVSSTAARGRSSAEDVGTLRELGRLIEAELVAMNLATNDALTGISNLRGFPEIGNHVLALSTRFAHSLRLLVVKIARLGELYRKHGSAAGERALVDVGQILLTIRIRHGSLEDLIAGAQKRLG